MAQDTLLFAHTLPYHCGRIYHLIDSLNNRPGIRMDARPVVSF